MDRLTLASQDFDGSLFNRMAARLRHPDPNCCRTEWQFSYHEAFRPDRPLLILAEGGTMVAFALSAHPRLGAVLEPIESHWLFGSPLLGEDPVGLLREFLGGEPFGGNPPALLISGVPARGRLWKTVLREFGGDHRIYRARPTVFASASLEGGIDGYLSRRTGNHRHKIRKAERRAAREGITIERHVPSAPAEVDPLYRRILAVEARSWKGIGECGMAEPPSSDFYRLLLRRWSAHGAARIAFARRDGEDVGFVFGGVNRGHYRGQQFSYAMEVRDLSVGNLLQMEQIRWLCEEGVQHYDMGPLMDYKVHWAETGRRRENLVLMPGAGVR